MAQDPVEPTVPHRNVCMQHTGERRDMTEGMRAAGLTGVKNILECGGRGRGRRCSISFF